MQVDRDRITESIWLDSEFVRENIIRTDPVPQCLIRIKWQNPIRLRNHEELEAVINMIPPDLELRWDTVKKPHHRCDHSILIRLQTDLLAPRRLRRRGRAFDQQDVGRTALQGRAKRFGAAGAVVSDSVDVRGHGGFLVRCESGNLPLVIRVCDSDPSRKRRRCGHAAMRG